MLFLSNQQKVFIQTHLLEAYALLPEAEWHEDDADEKIVQLQLRHFQTLTTPEELHFLLLQWNWDEGDHIPHQILAHPACDQETGLLLYWLLDPTYYARYTAAAQLPTYQQEEFSLFQQVEQRLLAGTFATAKIKFVPASCTDWLTLENPALPAALKVASPGQEWEA